MERYDACFCRNSMMTSFAGSKSWNFCGRRGVNSSTALRTAAGSNEDINSNAEDVNRETGGPRRGQGDAAAWRNLCLSGFVANARRERGFGRGQSRIAVCLRTIGVHCHRPSNACRGRFFVAGTD